MPLIQEAGGTLLAWSTQDGGPALAHGLLQRCWDLPGHPIGPDNSTVIEDGGAVVALLLGGEAGAWTRDESAHLVPLEGLARLPILQRFHRRLQTQRDARPALPAGAWYLSSLGVRPSHRRRGLARMLLAEATRHAHSHAGARILVEVVADNAGAVALYRSDGFQDELTWSLPRGPTILRLTRRV